MEIAYTMQNAFNCTQTIGWGHQNLRCFQMSCDNNGSVVNCCCWFTIAQRWCTPIQTFTFPSLARRVCVALHFPSLHNLLEKRRQSCPFNSEIATQSCVIGFFAYSCVIRFLFGFVFIFACSGNRSQCMIDFDVCNDHFGPISHRPCDIDTVT